MRYVANTSTPMTMNGTTIASVSGMIDPIAKGTAASATANARNPIVLDTELVAAILPSISPACSSRYSLMCTLGSPSFFSSSFTPYLCSIGHLRNASQSARVFRCASVMGRIICWVRATRVATRGRVGAVGRREAFCGTWCAGGAVSELEHEEQTGEVLSGGTHAFYYAAERIPRRVPSVGLLCDAPGMTSPEACACGCTRFRRRFAHCGCAGARTMGGHYVFTCSDCGAQRVTPQCTGYAPPLP